MEAAGGFEPPNNDFADRRLTTWLSRHISEYCKFIWQFCQARITLYGVPTPEDIYMPTIQANNLISTQADTKNHYAVALSAGGARGAYQFGCIKALADSGIQFTAVAGSSIGALNSSLLAQGDFDKGRKLWLNLTAENHLTIPYSKIGKFAFLVMADVALIFLPLPNSKFKLFKYFSVLLKVMSKHGSIGHLKDQGLFDLPDLRPFFEQYIDMGSVIDYDKPVYITVCDQPDVRNPLGIGQWFKLQDRTPADAWDLIMASMAIPFVFESVELFGKRCFDGGLANWLPIGPLYSNGYRKILAISTKANVTYDKRCYPDADIQIIGPDKPLGWFPVATFSFNTETILKWISEGYKDGLRFVDESKSLPG